jgi:TPR repeat protein
MYYNGLNVPQDSKEGILWYRKAAAAGSVAAKKDLEQLGLSPD